MKKLVGEIKNSFEFFNRYYQQGRVCQVDKVKRQRTKY